MRISRRAKRTNKCSLSNAITTFTMTDTSQVEPETCDYLVALSLPSRKPTLLEPDWTTHPDWEAELCLPFLDAAATPSWARLVDLPRGAGGLDAARSWGRYCLMRRKGTVYGTA